MTTVIKQSNFWLLAQLGVEGRLCSQVGEYYSSVNMKLQLCNLPLFSYQNDREIPEEDLEHLPTGQLLYPRDKADRYLGILQLKI